MQEDVLHDLSVLFEYMRPLVETAFELADQSGLPVIVSTDAGIKKDKYAHIGMTLVNTRMLGERSFMYDLVREPGCVL